MTAFDNLSNADVDLFQHLYDFKTLSLKQCWQLCYQDKTLDEASQRLFQLCDDGYLSYTPAKIHIYRFSLTIRGIKKLYEKRNIPLFVKDTWGQEIRNYKQPAELAIRDNIMSHQMALNQFLVDFITRWRDENVQDVTYQIEAEKGFRDLDYFRPDAMIKLTDKDGKNTFLFVEQDMGFESRKQLLLKWDKYQKFISTHRVDEEVDRAIMLFIIDYDTTKEPPHNMTFDNMDALYHFRTKEVCRSVTGLLALMLDGFFDCFINVKETLMECIFQRIVPEVRGDKKFEKEVVIPIFKDELGYKVSRAWNIKKRFYDTVFSYYVRKEKKDGTIEKDVNGENLAFMMDDASFTPLSLLAKAEHMERVNAFSASVDDKIAHCKYLIFSNEKDYLQELMTYCECTNSKDVLLL